MSGDEVQTANPGGGRDRPPRRADEDHPRRPLSSPADVRYRNVAGAVAYDLGVSAGCPGLGALLGPAALVLGILGVWFNIRHRTSDALGLALAGVLYGLLATLINWAVILVVLDMVVKGELP